MDNDATIADQKASLRRLYGARRAARSEPDRAAAARALLAVAASCSARVIAAFVPTAGEPGSLDVLDELCRHTEVLLPITARVGEPLRWAPYAGRAALVSGPYGLLQPAAATPASLADADAVLVPAVALGRDGTRLGHGGGFYDRALVGIPRDRLYGVVHDDEVAETLPVDAFDVRVGWICAPGALQPASGS